MSENEKGGGPESAINSTAQAVSALVKEVPIYQDAIQPGAQALGKGLGGFLDYLMQPLAILGIRARSNVQKFESEFIARAEKIPEEHLTQPSPRIVGSTLQALTYTIQEEELRALFVNLLAAASDARNSNKAHPSFVEIIRQLSIEDAELLSILGRMKEVAACRVVKMVSNDSFDVMHGHVIYLSSPGDLSSAAASIDNLVRLKVFDVNYLQFGLTDSGEYHKIHEVVKSIYPEAITDEGIMSGGEVVMQHGLLSLTEYGSSFVETCVL